MGAETVERHDAWTNGSYQYMPVTDQEFLRELGCDHLRSVTEEKLSQWLEYKLASVLSIEELEDVEDFALRCRQAISP